MVIKISKKITEKDACSILLKEKQELTVVNISEIKKSTKGNDDGNKYYFHIDYEMNDGTKFGVSYTFYLIDDVFKCGTLSKLFNLMKGLLDSNPLTDDDMEFDETDIAELILNKKFLASAIVQTIGGKNYPYIVLEKVIE